MFIGSRSRVTRSLQPRNVPATRRRRPWRLRLRRADGISTTEVVVISGMMVVTALLVMGIFRQEVTKAVTELSRCITGAVTGDVGACGGGGGGGGGTTTAAGPPRVPGMRDAGVAQGLVQAPPGKPGLVRGPNLPALPGDPRLANARNMLNSFNNRWNSNKAPDLSWQEKGVRLWNATSLFSANRDLVNRQDDLNQMADRSHDQARQWAQLAEQRLNAGDIAGFNDAMNRARRYENQTNRIRGNSASIMADAADQAMSEAADIRQISFETASAIGNPTGYVTGKAAGLVVGTAADQLLPDGRIKQVVVGVTTAAVSAYAGGMTPGAWQNMGAAASQFGQQASNAIGIADTVTSVTTTYTINGAEDAGWEIATNLITQKVMSTKFAGLKDPADPNSTGRSLGDYLANAPSAKAVRDTLEQPGNLVDIGQIDVSVKNAEALASNLYNKATGNAQRDPYTVTPLGADPAYVKTLTSMPDPTEATHPGLGQMIKDAESMGQTREMVLTKIKHAELTGGTFFDRGTQLEATQLIQNGQAVGKTTEQHQKSAGDRSPFLPMDTMESKIGDQVRGAKTPQQQADAADARAYNDHAINEALANNKVKAGDPPPGDTRITGKIAYDPSTNLPFVGDVDPVTNNLSKPGDPIRNGGVIGVGTTREIQDVANLKGALQPNNLQSTANHGHGARNPGKEPLPSRVIMYTPDGKVRVIEGQVNVLNAIRQSGCPEHPSWAAQAQQAQQANPGGPTVVPVPSALPPTPYNPRHTQGQAALANNRNTLRNDYVNGIIGNWQGTDRKDRKTPPAGTVAPPARPPEPDPDAVWLPVGWQDGGGLLPVQAGRPALVPASADVDWGVNRNFGLGLNKALDEYGSSWKDHQVLVHLKAYRRIRDHVVQEFTEKERIDIYARWAFGLLRGGPYPLPSVNQSAIWERVDFLATPAWRSLFDTDVRAGLQLGLSQYYAQQALTLGGRQAYPSYPAQTGAAQALIAAAGEAAVRRAYFHGEVWPLCRQIGTAVGAQGTDPGIQGLAYLRLIDQALGGGHYAEAMQFIARLKAPATKPAADVGARGRNRLGSL